MEISDLVMPCSELEVTQNMLILDLNNRMEVMDQSPDVMAEHHAAIMPSAC